MSAVVEHDPDLAARLAAAVGDRVTAVPGLEALDEHLDRHPQDAVVVVGPSVPEEAVARVAERYRMTRPRVGVILVRHEVDSATLTAALRAGMREVVAVDDAVGLRDAVDRAAALATAWTGAASAAQPGPPPRGGLVTVFSTKGGVGKSLVATNLAAALADSGRRVCLVDLDLASGDVAVLLRLTPQHTLAELADLGSELDESAVGSLLAQHSERLSVLAAPVQLSAPIPAERVGSLLDTLCTMFDRVVVDTSGSFDDAGVEALDRSDLLVLVGMLDIPSLKSLKLATGTLDLLNVPRERWRLVLNRADDKVGLTVAEFTETLGLRPHATLGSSREVLSCVNRGEQVVRSRRHHPVSRALVGLAAELDAALASPAEAPPASDAAGSRRARARRPFSRKAG